MILTPIVLAGMVLVATNDDSRCGPAEQVQRTMLRQYGELMIGERHDGPTDFLLFASKRGTWTIVRVDFSGKGCIVEAGRDWSVPEFRPEDAS